MLLSVLRTPASLSVFLNLLNTAFLFVPPPFSLSVCVYLCVGQWWSCSQPLVRPVCGSSSVGGFRSVRHNAELCGKVTAEQPSYWQGIFLSASLAVPACSLSESVTAASRELLQNTHMKYSSHMLHTHTAAQTSIWTLKIVTALKNIKPPLHLFCQI